jgi:lactate dehydrogenase-like 2-hydroxyacid dehydrogenase
MRRYNVVSLHCAANRVTAEIICAETLTWFKPGAQLINVTGAGAYTQPHLSPT